MDDYEYKVTDKGGGRVSVERVDRTFETWGAIIGGVLLCALCVGGLRDRAGDAGLVIAGVVSFCVGSALGWLAGMIAKYIFVIAIIVGIVMWIISAFK